MLNDKNQVAKHFSKNITIICIISTKKFGTKLQEINAYCLKLIILTIYTMDQKQLIQ